MNNIFKSIGVFICLTVLFSLSSCGGGSTTNIENQPQDPDNPVNTGVFQKQFMHGDVEREYIIYLPFSYNAKDAIPLLFAFHGLGGDMVSSFSGAGFDDLAEIDDFIVVHPQGLPLEDRQNRNGWHLFNGGADDVGFIAELLDELLETYAIDEQRVYSVGSSNGGFFSFALACRLNTRFAAIASVMGVMTQTEINTCQPERPTPVLSIHGTQDAVVFYSNLKPALDFWVANNETNAIPSVTILPDVNINDGSTVEEYVYENGLNGTSVKHFKVIGGGHDWPGLSGNMDISASEEAWNFVSQYNLNGLIK